MNIQDASGISAPILRALRIELNEAITKYSQYPASAKATLSPADFAKFYLLFRHLVDSTIKSVETTQDALQLNQDYSTSINQLNGEIQALKNKILALLINKPPPSKSLSRAEQRRRKAPKYRRENAPLSIRSLRCLDMEFGHQEWTAFDVITKTESELLRTPNFGRKSLKEVTNWLHSLRLKCA